MVNYSFNQSGGRGRADDNIARCLDEGIPINVAGACVFVRLCRMEREEDKM